MTEHLSEYDSLPHPSQHQNMHNRYAVALNYGTGLASCRQKPRKLQISKRMPLHHKRISFTRQKGNFRRLKHGILQPNAHKTDNRLIINALHNMQIL